MIRLIAGAVLALGLAGCVSPQQQAAADDVSCRQMGARPGTDIYIQCRMFQQRQRSQKEQADNAFLLAYGSRMMSSPSPTMVNCTSTRMGFQTNTTCY